MISIPLAFEVSTEIFKSVRKVTNTGIAGSTSLALSAACTIVAFQLIKLSYDVMSDEQQGGFGGIRLWQVLRPIIIILAINLSSTLFGWFDYVVNYFASSISSQYSASSAALVVSKLADAQDAAMLAGQSEKTKEGYYQVQGAEKKGEEAVASALDASNKIMNGAISDLSATESPGFFRRVGTFFIKAAANARASDPTAMVSDATTAVIFGQQVRDAEIAAGEQKMREQLTQEQKEKANEAVSDQVDDTKTNVDSKVSSLSASAQATGSLKSKVEQFGEDFVDSLKSGNLFMSLAYWLYDLAYFILNAMVEIIRAILTIMFPWTLVLSLFSHFKDAVWKYIATYVNVSFWKVTASIINWAVTTSVPAMYLYTTTKLMPTLSSSGYATKIGALIGLGSAVAMLYVAGFIALTKVASLTNMYIPNANVDAMTSDSAMGIASTAATTAMHTVTQAPGKVATVATGALGKAAGAAGKAAKGAGNALGKVGGGSKNSVLQNYGADWVSE